MDTPHTHAYTSTVISPSCTEDGYTLYVCSLCGEQYSDQITQALGHDYKETVEDAFCNQKQQKHFECSVCRYSYTEELETPGTIHSYVSTVTPPDRENEGYTTHTCKNCTDSYVDSYTDPVNFSLGLAYTKKSGGYYVSGMGTCKDTDVIIPAISEQGYKVVGIAGNAFANSNVTSIIASDGVDDIQESAFYNCAALESVTLGKGANPSENIFSKNPVLTKLTMPMKKPIAFYFQYYMTVPQGYKGLEQGDGSFAGTYYGAIPLSLREVNILNSPCVSALSGCDMLTQITIAPNATEIGAFAFRNCTGLTEFTIPDSVRSIGGYAFAATSVSSVTIPENVARVGVRIFANCKSLKTVAFSSDNNPIESEMFSGASALQSIRIPKNVTEIPFRFCEGATALKTITFNEGLVVIKEEAFLGCTSIQSITFPTTLESIWEKSFKGCTSLQSVDFSGANMSEEASKRGVEWFADCTALSEIKNHDGLIYINASIFNNTPIQVVKNGMTITLGWLVKVSPEELQRVVVVPEGVTKIYDYVFRACKNIEEVILPEGVTFLGLRIFGGSDGSSLVKVSFPDSLTSISGDTICFLPQIEEIVVGTGLQEFDGDYFGNLKTIRFRGTIAEFKKMPWCELSTVQSMTVICTNGTVEPTQE